MIKSVYHEISMDRKTKVGGKMPDWKKLEGKRILVKTKSGLIFEAVVKEVSKSGKYVKLQFEGTTTWNDTNNMQFEFLEVLDQEEGVDKSEQ